MKTFLNVLGQLAFVGVLGGLITMASAPQLGAVIIGASLFEAAVFLGMSKIIALLEQTAAAAKTPAAVTVAAARAQMPPPPGTETFHVYHGGEIIGPYPHAQLRELLAKGTLRPDQWVIPEGGARWVRAREALATG